eukprot:TRINITY_DN12943_c0_g1_i1.p1 TRINITY_DN12943_c0_g1~~TRINITY_DN12943_c0_g1_i1.p1  ORF type:complete len:294 (+),score=80.24 TRINITY_DN12943_c0_g1_i1:174-1055(+)
MQNFDSEENKFFLQERDSEEFTFIIKRESYFGQYNSHHFPIELKDRITPSEFAQIINCVSRIHKRHTLLHAWLQALTLLVTIFIVVLIISFGYYKPFLVILGILAGLLIPICYAIIRNILSRDNQIFSTKKFIKDLNIEYRKVGLKWHYSSPQENMTVSLIPSFEVEEEGLIKEKDDESDEDDNYMFDEKEEEISILEDRSYSNDVSFDDLFERNILASTRIPKENHTSAKMRISLFPNHKVSFTIIIGDKDMDQETLSLETICKFENVNIWDRSCSLNSSRLLEYLRTFINS